MVPCFFMFIKKKNKFYFISFAHSFVSAHTRPSDTMVHLCSVFLSKYLYSSKSHFLFQHYIITYLVKLVHFDTFKKLCTFHETLQTVFYFKLVQQMFQRLNPLTVHPFDFSRWRL